MGKNGGQRPGAGRKKGIKSKLKAEMKAAYVIAGKSPLEFLVEKYQDVNTPLAYAIEAAGKAAPYVHRKQPIDVNHSGEIGTTKRIILEGVISPSPTPQS